MKKLSVIDYLIIVLVLLLSLLIGLNKLLRKYYLILLKPCYKVFKCKQKNEKKRVQKSEIDEYLIANASMSAIPLTLSLFATYFSANSILGYSVEVYQYGIQFWLFVFGVMATPFIGAFATGPLFQRCEAGSVFEYLKLRYNSSLIRSLTVFTYLVRSMISTALYIYGPGTTLNYLTSLNPNVSIIIIGIIGTFYTAIGGIRAVIWTDVFQTSFMFAGLIIIIAKGVVDIGGFDELLRINRDGGRLELFIFNPNPLIRQNFWSIIIGTTFHYFIYYGLDQQMLQRFASAKTIRTAQTALLLNLPLTFVFLSMCCFCGLVAYAIYFKCDPGNISGSGVVNVNQIIPYLVVDRLSSINGAIGIFLACIFASALSSVSSILNSSAAVLWSDFLSRYGVFSKMDDRKSTITTKILVVICGIIATSMAFLVANIGLNVTQMSFALNGAFNSPIVGVFILASLVPFSNKYGAIFSIIAGFSIGLLLTFGPFFNMPIYPKLPIGTQCLNITSNSSFHPSPLHYKATNLSGLKRFYSLSYTWYTTFGILTTIISGVIISVITGCNKNDNHDQYLFKCVQKFKKPKGFKVVNVSDEEHANNVN